MSACKKTPISDAKIFDLPKITDPQGNLTFIENHKHVPFGVKRVFYLYDVPGGTDRAGHAHKECEQFIIAASGSFDVVLNNGDEKVRFHLNRPSYGLLVPKMIWNELDNFSSNSVCLVMASELYNEEDYYRNYDEFMKALH